MVICTNDEIEDSSKSTLKKVKHNYKIRKKTSRIMAYQFHSKVACEIN